MSARLSAAAVALTAFSAGAVPFTITIANNATTGPAWSTGLLTLQPLITIGLAPKADAGGPYATYEFTNSNCPANCTRNCDDGNAALLATRWGLTVGTNAWVVNALALGTSQTLTIDVPVNSTLSYIAWLNDTSVFDDFVAMHVPGNTSALAVPMFSGGVPLDSVDFVISGYDSNSTSATDGSGATCTNECPASQNGINCYVAPGDATYGSSGALNTVTPGIPAINVTAVSAHGQVHLAWSNQSPHAGVLIARSTTGAVSFTPTQGATYQLGHTIGNATVAYVADGSDHAFTDTGLADGTRYFYKVYNYGSGHGYASGDVPSSNGIFSDPTTQKGANPRWCYSFGLPSLQQPTTELGVSVYTASNTGALTANQTLPGSMNDGWELWRPTSLAGAVQVRASLVPLFGRSGEWLVTADFSGFAYLVDASNGVIAWQSADLGELIQAQPVAQLNAYANAAFQSAQPNRDLIFVGTHNTSSHNNNGVFALSSVDGTTRWSYVPTGGNNRLDWVTGMAVDYLNNRLYVAAYGAGTQLSLRVLNSATGALITSLDPGGDLTMGVNLRAPHGSFTEVITSSSDGHVYGISVPADGGTPAQLWAANVGSAPTAYAFPLSDGFVAPLSNSTLARWTVTEPVDGGTITSAVRWSVAVPTPSGVSIDYTNNWLYVGGSDGRLRQLNLDDGGTVNSFLVNNAGAIGTPTIDTTANRVHVGTQDGRLCAFPNPLQ